MGRQAGQQPRGPQGRFSGRGERLTLVPTNNTTERAKTVDPSTSQSYILLKIKVIVGD